MTISKTVRRATIGLAAAAALTLPAQAQVDFSGEERECAKHAAQRQGRWNDVPWLRAEELGSLVPKTCQTRTQRMSRRVLSCKDTTSTI